MIKINTIVEKNKFADLEVGDVFEFTDDTDEEYDSHFYLKVADYHTAVYCHNCDNTIDGEMCNLFVDLHTGHLLSTLPNTPVIVYSSVEMTIKI